MSGFDLQRTGAEVAAALDAVPNKVDKNSVLAPALTVAGAPSDVLESPTLTTTNFFPLGADTHLNTDWQVLSGETVIWESLADTSNLLSISVPAGNLSTSTSYTFRARHRGTAFGASEWAEVTATTAAEFSVYPAGFDDLSSLDSLPESSLTYDATTDTGYYGEVPAATLFTGDDLASEIGLTAGTSQHSTEPWLKFYVGPTAGCNRNGGQAYILYIAKKPSRHTVSWGNLNTRNAVYSGGTTVVKGGYTKDVTLLTGAEADPGENAGGEWDALIYRVHTDVPADQVGDNWETFTDADIIVASGDGRGTWCQDTRTSDSTRRGTRGFSLSALDWLVSSTATSPVAWRPALRPNYGGGA